MAYTYDYDENKQQYIVNINNRIVTIDNKTIIDLSDKLDLEDETQAIDCYLSDRNLISNVEQNELDTKAKKIKISKGITRKEKKESNRVRKVDNIKLYIFNEIENSLKDIATITGRKNEVELSFSYENENYTLKLTRHRPPKKEKR
jgi:hypothetical protein